jgi:hypothetical protein
VDEPEGVWLVDVSVVPLGVLGAVDVCDELVSDVDCAQAGPATQARAANTATVMSFVRNIILSFL